jgi:hypothetical protein
VLSEGRGFQFWEDVKNALIVETALRGRRADVNRTAVSIPKGSSVLNKICSTNDFRGIAISSVISKVFEKCKLSLYADCFSAADNQLGFKKGTGCNNAIFCLRETVDDYIYAAAIPQMWQHLILLKNFLVLITTLSC